MPPVSLVCAISVSMFRIIRGQQSRPSRPLGNKSRPEWVYQQDRLFTDRCGMFKPRIVMIRSSTPEILHPCALVHLEVSCSWRPRGGKSQAFIFPFNRAQHQFYYTQAMPQLYVKTIANRKQAYNYENDYLIKNLKEDIQSKQGLNRDQFRLIFAGKQLAEDTKILDTGINPGDTIHMIATLRGG